MELKALTGFEFRMGLDGTRHLDVTKTWGSDWRLGLEAWTGLRDMCLIRQGILLMGPPTQAVKRIWSCVGWTLPLSVEF
jgi:hypothetical protein